MSSCSVAEAHICDIFEGIRNFIHLFALRRLPLCSCRVSGQISLVGIGVMIPLSFSQCRGTVNIVFWNSLSSQQCKSISSVMVLSPAFCILLFSSCPLFISLYALDVVLVVDVP